MKDHGNCDRCLKIEGKKESLLSSRRLRRKTCGTTGWSASPWFLGMWWGKSSLILFRCQGQAVLLLPCSIVQLQVSVAACLQCNKAVLLGVSWSNYLMNLIISSVLRYASSFKLLVLDFLHILSLNFLAWFSIFIQIKPIVCPGQARNIKKDFCILLVFIFMSLVWQWKKLAKSESCFQVAKLLIEYTVW